MALEVTYKTRNGRMAIKATGNTPKEVFGNMASLVEILDAAAVCGKCGDAGIVPRMRTIDKDAYYEMACTNPKCRATLSFGQTREGGLLFAKRKDKDDNWLSHDGWSVYRKPGTADEEPEHGRPGQPEQRRQQAPTAGNRAW